MVSAQEKAYGKYWLQRVNVEALYIEPGSPWENGYAESFHNRLRDEFLAVEALESLMAARKLTPLWKVDYSCERPHGSPSCSTPQEFAAKPASFSAMDAPSCRSCRLPTSGTGHGGC